VPRSVLCLQTSSGFAANGPLRADYFGHWLILDAKYGPQKSSDGGVSETEVGTISEELL